MIDMHIHSINSDGKKTVIEILKQAERIGLKYISITDHDNVKAYEELKNINIKEYFSGKVITGVEFKCYFNENRIEVLAYNIDIQIIQNFLSEYYKDRKFEKMQKIYLEYLYNVCINQGLKMDDIKDIIWNSEKEWATVVIYREIIKHKENEKLLPKDLWENPKIFYRKYTSDKDSPFCMDKIYVYPKIEYVISAIKAAGGKAIIAHPYVYSFKNTDKFLENVINSKIGIDGIECYHSSFSNNQIEHLKNFCIKNNLYMSGGSDYHGEDEYDNKIGIGRGNLNIPDKVAETILK